MKVRAFEYSDLDSINPKAKEANLRGITIVGDDGCPVACGGIMEAPWGNELWIEARPGLSERERLGVARVSREYVSVMLPILTTVYAHIFEEDRGRLSRWFDWLGFTEAETIRPRDQRAVVRYVLEAEKWV